MCAHARRCLLINIHCTDWRKCKFVVLQAKEAKEKKKIPTQNCDHAVMWLIIRCHSKRAKYVVHSTTNWYIQLWHHHRSKRIANTFIERLQMVIYSWKSFGTWVIRVEMQFDGATQFMCVIEWKRLTWALFLFSDKWRYFSQLYCQTHQWENSNKTLPQFRSECQRNFP